MKSILGILKELSETTKRTEKEIILKRNISTTEGEELLRAFKAAYNTQVKFNVKKIPEYTPNTGEADISLTVAIDFIEQVLAKRVKTGNAARDELKNYLEMLSADDAEVLSMIIDRDLRCGVSKATINKIWGKDTIPSYDVMLANTDKSYIKYPAIGQIKCDGVRAHLLWNGEQAILTSRNGKIIEIGDVLDGECKRVFGDSQSLLDGELLVLKADGNPMERRRGNGIINKAIKGTITEKECANVIFMAWDLIDEERPYDIRLNDLQSLITDETGKIRVVESRKINSLAEAEEYFIEAVDRGEEGIILKNAKARWQGKRTKDLCKFKSELDADLMIVGWELGTGRNANRLGNLIGESSDGLLRVSVGTGFSDKDRDTLTEENTVGKVMTVQYNQKVQKEDAKDAVEWALFLPRFIEIREDKTVANSFEEIK